MPAPCARRGGRREIETLVTNPLTALILAVLALALAALPLVVALGILVAGAAVAEFEPVDDARLLEELHRAVDGGQADVCIDLLHRRINLLGGYVTI